MMKKLELLVGILMVVVGLMLGLHRPDGSGSPVAEAQSLRVLQVWPDRYVSVTSALLEGLTSYKDTRTLAFGVYRRPSGDVVYARTYLHFPVNVFPPGTDVRRATLHICIDSAYGSGETSVGVYRVLEPWRDAGWKSDPDTWPALLPAPLAVTRVQLTTVPATLPTPTLMPTAWPSPTPTFTPTAPPATDLTLTPTVTPTALPAPDLTLTPTVTPTTPLTPELTLTPTVTPTAPPTPDLTLTPILTPTPGLNMSPGQTEPTWVSWDVTVLMRAWIGGEIANDGLAIATAPHPAALPEEAGNLLVVHRPLSDTLATRPYVVAEFDVLPVTPTPSPSPLTPGQLLPVAGGSSGPAGWVLFSIGVLLLLLVWRTGSNREGKEHG